MAASCNTCFVNVFLNLIKYPTKLPRIGNIIAANQKVQEETISKNSHSWNFDFHVSFFFFFFLIEEVLCNYAPFIYCLKRKKLF